jgi:hypothetical protein
MLTAALSPLSSPRIYRGPVRWRRGAGQEEGAHSDEEGHEGVDHVRLVAVSDRRESRLTRGKD